MTPKSIKAVKIGSRKSRKSGKIQAYKTGQTTRIRRVDPYSEDWNTIRKKVWEKCGGSCKCGSTDRLEVHHIVRVSRGGRNNLSNLTLLCHDCHKKQPGHKHLH